MARAPSSRSQLADLVHGIISTIAMLTGHVPELHQPMTPGLGRHNGKSIARTKLVHHDHHGLLHNLEPLPLHIFTDVEHDYDVHAMTRHLPAMTPWRHGDLHQYWKLAACLMVHNSLASCEHFHLQLNYCLPYITMQRGQFEIN
jgi:hypothetical protein